MDSLPFPKIIVPGDHDIPLFNLFARFAKKLDRYRRFIIEDLEPFYSDHEIAVLGVNTARSATFKGGRVRQPDEPDYGTFSFPSSIKINSTQKYG
ncbi:MAG: hypothetical protein WD688_11085 [Candidatus Binatia bacterium]